MRKGVVLSAVLLPIFWIVSAVFGVVLSRELELVLEAVVAVVVIGWPVWVPLYVLAAVTAIVLLGARATSYVPDVAVSLTVVAAVGVLVWTLWERMWLVEQVSAYIPGSVLYLLSVDITARHRRW